jgi:protein-S-isoprenylcysteine O-methyltransferase Ste14
VQARTQKKVKASDPWLTTSMILTSLCFLMAIASVYSEYWYQKMGAIGVLRSDWLSYVGFFLFGFSIISGWVISAQLKESWRVGVHQDEKTELVKTGIYAYVRNPYFSSYFIMFLGLFLIRPGLAMVVLIISTIGVFHLLVMKEETHLMNIHGKDYEEFKNSTGRYIPLFLRGDKIDKSK